MLLVTLEASLLANILGDKIIIWAGERVIWTSEEVLATGRGWQLSEIFAEQASIIIWARNK